MSFDLMHSTQEERSDKIDALVAQIDALEDKIPGVNAQIDQLTAENAHYFTRQEALANKSNKMRSAGEWLIFLGIATVVVFIFFLKNFWVIGLVTGLCLAVLGVILCIGEKKCSEEYKSISQDLIPYYAEKDKYQEQIQAYKQEIDAIELQILEIADYDKQLAFNELTERSGHYLMIVTCEENLSRIGVPDKPLIGKKYASIHKVKDSLLYFNGTILSWGKTVFGKNQDFMITYAKPAPGTRTCSPQITYIANGQKETYPPYWDGPWVDGMTMYKWYHISINDEHSLVYPETFSSLEDLCKTLNITKAEIVDNI